MPNYFYLDASALAKRYAPEPGSLVVDHLFSRLSPQRMFVLHLGVAEVVSILVRKYNAQRLSFSDFSQAFANVGTEIINQSALRKPAASAKFINASLALISKHSINATDAVLLRSALDMAAGLRASGDDLVDQCFLEFFRGGVQGQRHGADHGEAGDRHCGGYACAQVQGFSCFPVCMR